MPLLNAWNTVIVLPAQQPGVVWISAGRIPALAFPHGSLLTCPAARRRCAPAGPRPHPPAARGAGSALLSPHALLQPARGCRCSGRLIGRRHHAAVWTAQLWNCCRRLHLWVHLLRCCCRCALGSCLCRPALQQVAACTRLALRLQRAPGQPLGIWCGGVWELPAGDNPAAPVVCCTRRCTFLCAPPRPFIFPRLKLCLALAVRPCSCQAC